MKKIEKLIGIIGRISSGKSHLAKKLSTEQNIPIISFGSYLLNYSKIHNLPVDRISLQNLGERFIAEEPNKFLLNVIDHGNFSGDTLIVEGIRHKVIFDLLRETSWKSQFLYIDESIDVRFTRYNSRNKESDSTLTFEQFQSVDNHPVEQEIQAIRSSCDLEINSEVDTKTLFNKISIEFGKEE